MGSDNDKRRDFPPWAGMDHLSYLRVNPLILRNDKFFKSPDRDLTCSECRHPVTRVSQRIEVFGRHDHSFRNLGYLVQLGCFREAPGCFGVQGISYGYSWFRGYAWQIQVCRNCYTQLGWKYMSEHDSFYGLIFNTLREKESEGENKDES